MDIKPYIQELIINPQAEHYQQLKGAIWLLLYLLCVCGKNTWIIVRKIDEIAEQMGVKPRTVQYWLALLEKHQYLLVKKGNAELFIHIRGGVDLLYQSKK